MHPGDSFPYGKHGGGSVDMFDLPSRVTMHLRLSHCDAESDPSLA